MRRLLALALLLIPFAANAYPDRPVTIINPYATGSSTDAAARAFCLDLHQRLSLATAPARLPVMPEEEALIDALSEGEAPLPLPRSQMKRGIVPCAVTFKANRPHLIATGLRRAA